jgi:hypothetical protein
MVGNTQSQSLIAIFKVRDILERGLLHGTLVAYSIKDFWAIKFTIKALE